MSHISEVEEFSLKSGLRRYRVEVWHEELHQHRVFEEKEPELALRKAQMQAQAWDEKHAKAVHLENAQHTAQQRTAAAEREQEEITTLAATADGASIPSWDQLVLEEAFREPAPRREAVPPAPVAPPLPDKPDPRSDRWQLKLGLMDHMFPDRQKRKKDALRAEFREAVGEWQDRVEAMREKHDRLVREHNATVNQVNRAHAQAMAGWEDRRTSAQELMEKLNAIRSGYERGQAAEVEGWAATVLDRMQIPEWLHLEHDEAFDSEIGALIVDLLLPDPDGLPRLESVRFVKTRDELVEKEIAVAKRKQNFDAFVYGIILRTISCLFRADEGGHYRSITLNARVNTIDPATGAEITPCIASLSVGKAEFAAVNLSAVDPKACFRGFKGMAATRIHMLQAVPPVMTINREDARFVDGDDVVTQMQEGVNLAAIGWEDFEHLIRQLFEMEFAGQGGEVRVTQSSGDGGVDAVIFDPDPIRGGKMIVQAKRYTNTVSVSAVRDLYGTVVNEGAMKGILVTTSDFGPDAHRFANEKPLVLINGANLLHLMEKHGQKARIDLAEARKLGDPLRRRGLDDPTAEG